jgi:hypothetical protein
MDEIGKCFLLLFLFAVCIIGNILTVSNCDCCDCCKNKKKDYDELA